MIPDANTLENYEARHATCTDDDDPELASEIVFTLMHNGCLSVDVWGKGKWPNCQLMSLTLTQGASDKLITYPKQA